MTLLKISIPQYYQGLQKVHDLDKKGCFQISAPALGLPNTQKHFKFYLHDGRMSQ